MMKHMQKIDTLTRKERIETEITSTDQILLRSGEEQKKLRTELKYLVSHAFPNMPKQDLDSYISDYFIQPGEKLRRQVIFFRNESDKLIAATIFDYKEVQYGDTLTRGIYLISRTILPECQGAGLGKTIAQKILTEFQADVLFTTCAQSSSLHSWVGLPEMGLMKKFEVYPRLEQKGILKTLPYSDLNFAISVFRQVYFGVAEGKQENLDEAIRNLTVVMVRKNLYGKMYDFNPWEKNKREDKLAKALGVTNKDGVLVMFRKKDCNSSFAPLN